MAATASWRSCRRVRLASEALLAYGVALMLSSICACKYAQPLSHRSVIPAAHFSDGGVRVDKHSCTRCAGAFVDCFCHGLPESRAFDLHGLFGPAIVARYHGLALAARGRLPRLLKSAVSA